MADMIYILTNPTIPDLVMIGKTTDLEERMGMLNFHPGVAAPFECYYCCEVNDSNDVETRIFSAFEDHRVNPKRGFFKIDPEKIKIILEGLSIRDICVAATPYVTKKPPKPKPHSNGKRKPFRFSMVGIKTGTILRFVKDQNITCRVISDKNVEFEGSSYLMSPLTRKLMTERYGSKTREFRGSSHWIFEGETLTARRERMEVKPMSDDCFK